MGNEQSNSTTNSAGRTSISNFNSNSNQPSTSATNSVTQATSTPSAFSFLTRQSTKKSKGIIVVREGGRQAEETLEHDEIYKRLQEIPRFLPLIRSAVGKGKDLPIDNRQKISSRAIFKFATRFQDHLAQCAKMISSNQAQLVTAIKSTDLESSATTSMLTRKKRSYSELVSALQQIDDMNREVEKIQNLLSTLVPQIESLNELLPSSERLQRLDLRGILESSASSLNSTPSPARKPNAPQSKIEEIRVRDCT